MQQIKKWFLLNTVRKKVFFLSKLSGCIIILFYVFTSKLPTSQEFTFIVWFILLMSVILFVDAMLEYYISKPLDEINKTAQQMAKLDFSAHCDIASKDEFGDLSQNLNHMFSKLQKTLIELETANQQLEKDVAQEHLYLVQRKELVDHLSHEMKTPLGIIRGFSEALKDEKDEQQRQHYLDVVIATTSRMNAMIVSLLDLSALEGGAAKLNEERFDFIELVETVAGRLLMDIPSGIFQFTYELPDKEIFIYSDKYRMEQVLNNFIVNAKNHTCKCGRIHLVVSHDEGQMRFSIFNQGDHIPSHEITKIWTKFYRGENTQTKTVGSGLGLSIVAQIFSILHIDYGVQNVDEGVEFYFRFPIIES